MRILGSALLTVGCVLSFSLTAKAASLLLFPNTVELEAGESIIIDLRLDTQSESITAVEVSGTLSGPLTLDSLDTSGGLIEIWVEEGSTRKTFRIVGGTPKGAQGSGIIARLTVTAIESGAGTITLDPNAKVILLGDEAQLAQVSLIDSAIRVTSPDPGRIELASRTHPDQNQWYSSRKVNVRWDLEEGAQYSYSVDPLPNIPLDDIADFPEGTLEWQGDVEFTAPSDGIFYFTVKRVGESSISRHRVMIDTQKPQWIDWSLSEGEDFPNQPLGEFISFVARDDLSGIEKYQISIDGEQFFDTVSPQILPSGYSEATIRAYDRAGNYIEKGVSKDRGLMLMIISLAILLALVLLLGLKRKRMQSE